MFYITCKEKKKKREKKKKCKYLQVQPTLIISSDPCLRTASAVIGIQVGSEDEFPGNFGVAHLLEHLIFRGTRDHPSQLKLVMEFVRLGAKFNGETGRDRTLFYMTSLPDRILPAIKLLIEMVKQPLFDPSVFEVEKQAVMNEIKTARSEPSAFLQNELLLPNVLRNFYPRYHTPMGIAEDVKRASFQSVIDLYRSAYTNNSRIVISLHGNLLTKKCPTIPILHDHIQKLWSSIPCILPSYSQKKD